MQTPIKTLRAGLAEQHEAAKTRKPSTPQEALYLEGLAAGLKIALDDIDMIEGAMRVTQEAT